MVRNPADALVSMFHFHESWLLEPGAVSLEEYGLEQFMLGGRSGNYWQLRTPSTVYLLTVGQQRCEKAKLVPATRDCQPGCTQHSLSSGQRRWASRLASETTLR